MAQLHLSPRRARTRCHDDRPRAALIGEPMQHPRCRGAGAHELLGFQAPELCPKAGRSLAQGMLVRHTSVVPWRLSWLINTYEQQFGARQPCQRGAQRDRPGEAARDDVVPDVTTDRRARREAPTTATVLGLTKCSSAAVCSRCSKRSRASADGDAGSPISITWSRRSPQREAAFPVDVEHALVLWQHVGYEP